LQVENVLVEEIILSDPTRSALARATLFEFGEPRWVSQHHERGDTKVGPMTLLKDVAERDQEQRMSVRRFPERKLHQEGKSRLAISYRETWTAPLWSIFALVLPCEFTAVSLSFNHHDNSKVEFQTGTTDKGQLFYFEVLGHAEGQHVFDVEARIEEDHDKYSKAVKSSESVEGTSNFKNLRRAVGQEALTPDLWLKLLELGGKILGHS
jgi:hypothetical protein